MKKSINYYADIYVHYDSGICNMIEKAQQIALEQLIQQDLSGVVVDIGCGTGNMLYLLIQKFKFDQIYGIDLSEEMLNVARNKIPNLVAICDCATSVQQHFPAPIANVLIFHFLFAYVDYKKFIMQASMVALPRSILSIATTTSNTFSKSTSHVLNNLKRTVSIIKFLCRVNVAKALSDYIKSMPQDLNELQKLVEQSGYEVLNAKSVRIPVILKTWREVWRFSYDSGWFVGGFQQYKVNKFKMFCIFYIFKMAGLLNSDGYFEDFFEIAIITAIKK